MHACGTNPKKIEPAVAYVGNLSTTFHAGYREIDDFSNDFTRPGLDHVIREIE